MNTGKRILWIDYVGDEVYPKIGNHEPFESFYGKLFKVRVFLE